MSMSSSFENHLQAETMRFSCFWLVVSNGVGLLLAFLLVFPGAGQVMGILTYGRWMPLHMEWHLYGWCSLPLLGLLMKEFLGTSKNGIGESRFALLAWSMGLIAGGVAFLSGHASGKLFLSWSGFSRVFFPLSLCVVWSVLATAWIRDWRNPAYSGWRSIFRALILLVLAGVPLALYYASSGSIYPPVNPGSGGATGHSLLASSLGILGLFGIIPFLLGLIKRPSAMHKVFWISYALCWMGYQLIQHGSVPNTERDQIIGLGSLMGMTPVLILYYNAWQWPEGTRPWRIAFFIWWSVLAVSGWITFLPGTLDSMKFTNGMVAHAHLAMAGMITAFNFILMASLSKTTRVPEAGCFGGWHPFILWNLACACMVSVLLIQGVREGLNPAVLFGPDSLTLTVYALRMIAGVCMFIASVWWLRSVWKLKKI
jgi:cytochrome c oxidase cbb3-type subunit 1